MVHRLFAEILAAHGMPQSQPEWFRATCGRQRAFLSQADADAYDRGFNEYPAQPDTFQINNRGNLGPSWDGYRDAEDLAQGAQQ